jgi:Protein of unknown function (DUF3131)
MITRNYAMKIIQIIFGLLLTSITLAQSTPTYLNGWELFRSGKFAASAQEWMQVSLRTSQRKGFENLKEAAFTNVLASIAFAHEGDNRAYGRWADAIRLYLEAGSSWEQHRLELRARWRKNEQALTLAGEAGPAGLSVADRFLIDMVNRVNLIEYQGPKSGLGESRDGTVIIAISPQYFAGAALTDATSEIVIKESRYASLPESALRDTNRLPGFSVDTSVNTLTSSVKPKSIGTPGNSSVLASSINSTQQVPANRLQASGPVLSSPGISSLSQTGTTEARLFSANPFGRGGVTPGNTTEPEVASANFAASLTPQENSLNSASNAQLLGFSRMGNSASDTVQKTASDLSVARAQSASALIMPRLFTSTTIPRPITDFERARAIRAWRYIQANRNGSTGLVNGKDSYPVASVADFAHAIAGYISALSLQLIDKESFDTDMRQILSTLKELPFYNQEIFNREYDTRSGRLLDLSVKASTIGSGWAAGDIGRLLIWLKIVFNNFPDLKEDASAIVARLKLNRMVNGNELSSSYAYSNGEQLIKNLRLGEEQYAAAGLALWGIILPESLNYTNAKIIEIGKIRIPTDIRNDAYISPDIFAKGVIELGGLDGCFERASLDALDAQLQKGKESGRPLMVADENLDQAPWFVYGSLWMQDKFGFVGSYDKNARTDLATFSLKAAHLWIAVLPGVSTQLIKNFADEIDGTDRGMFAGRYNSGALNTALTLETNALILESLAYSSKGKKSFLRFENPTNFNCSALAISKKP